MIGSYIRQCCMLWKQLEDESTVISLSCDSLLERATQLDQSFCAFRVHLIHLIQKHLNRLKCFFSDKKNATIFRVSPAFLNAQQDLWCLLRNNSSVYFFFQVQFYTVQNVRIWYSFEEAQLKDELFSNKERCDLVPAF